MQWFFDLISNPFLVTGLSSWILAQIVKAIIHAIMNKSFDFERLTGDGGMPSSHSATVMSLAVITGLTFGLKSFEFAFTFLFAVITCRDAMGVRREVGKHAAMINEMTAEKSPETKLKEFVGHTPVQVTAGAILGAANAILMYNLFN